MILRPGHLRKPISVPPFDLNFAAAGTLDGRVTFTRSSSATYFNSSGVLQTAATGVARFDYDPVALTARGLLIEESRTNLALQSNQFDTTWSLAANTSRTAASGTSPDGTNNAWKLAESTTVSAQHSVAQAFVKAASALPYTFTLYAKAVERTSVALQVNSGGNGISAVFDLSGGTVSLAETAFGAGFTTGTATIQSVGNGWYRCVLPFTSDATTALAVSPLTAIGNNTSYAGTIGSGILIYGAQLEQASSQSTIEPTTTASVTRAAEVATIARSSTSIPASPSALTIAIQGRTAFGNSADQVLFQIDDGSSSNRIWIFRQASTNTVFAVATVSGSNTAALSLGAVANDTDLKIAFRAQTNSFSASLNGGAVVTSGSGALPTGLTTLRLGADSASAYWNRTIGRARIYTRGIADAQLVALAT